MLDQTKSDAEHIEHANSILKVTQIHRTHLVEPLHNLNQELDQLLTHLEKLAERMPNNAKRVKLKSWLTESKNLYLNRRVQSNYVLSSEEWEE
jgi:hypothetical protein